VRKSKTFRPDYQTGRGGAEGLLYKPWKLLALPEGGFICLMHEIQDDTWLIFSLDAKGVAARSKVYRMKSVGEVMWRELCHELTEAAKNKLIDEAKTASPDKRVELVKELARLEIADDEKCEGIAARAEQFCASHADAEVQEHVRHLGERLEVAIRAETARYDAMRVESDVNE
jgi:hypothetical protein